MMVALNILAAIWGNPWGRTLLIGTGLFLWGVAKGWGWAAAGRDAAIQRAIVARDIHWQETINKANMDHERKMQEAIAAANSVSPVRTSDELKRLCSDATRGANCRDKDIHGLQGIQKN